MLGTIKTYMMPIAMAIGIVFYMQVAEFAALTPYLIGIMLFLTYCNIDYKKIRFTKFHFVLLGIQLLGSVLVYIICLPFSTVLAQGAMICVLAPTATSAPVITGILGGDVESLSTYSLLCNVAIAFVAPVCFALTGNVDANTFWQAVARIGKNTFILLLLPFVLAYAINRLLPEVHKVVRSWKFLTFYLWSFALVIITGQTVRFILEQSSYYGAELVLALVALVICSAQFMLGRFIGSKYNNTVAGGQGLGQKNTILAIWMAQSYLNPISSVAPGAYVLWQNMVNSFQVWRVRKTLRSH